MTFLSNPKFDELLFKQRHQCRLKRQKVLKYGMDELYQELENHYQLFSKYLLPVFNVLDLGCGLGYIDAVIFSHHKDANFYLLDSWKSVSHKVYNFYNDLSLTREFLELNGMPTNQIHLVDATPCGTSYYVNDAPEVFNIIPKIDLAISCYYLGWHATITKYIADISKVMNPGGLLVLDCKGEVENFNQLNGPLILENGFEVVELIQMFQGKYILIARKL